MNKKELKKHAVTKKRLKAILALRKNKKYDKIYQLYGRTIYNLATPSKIRKREVERLMDEGRFEEIYAKFGKTKYVENLDEMYETDIYNETGKKPDIFKKLKFLLVNKIMPITMASTVFFPTATVAATEINTRKMKSENAIQYAEEIENYDKKIEKYAQKVNSMHLSDIQIFMKVMSDMWKEIDGYATPKEYDVMGFWRLSLNEEGVGVCRNFSDDITAKLNAINPKYNARNVVVYMGEEEYNLANIDRNIIQNNNTVASNDEQENSNEEEEIDITKFFGNHAVTAVDIPEQNITLILDPTNPGIGVFKDGQIYMFSTPDGKGIQTKALGQLLVIGADQLANLMVTEVESFLNGSQISLVELEEMYGTDAQNKALEQLENREHFKREFIERVNVNHKKALEDLNRNLENEEIKENAQKSQERE